MSGEFERENARVYLASTATLTELNTVARAHHRAALCPDEVHALDEIDNHVLSPLVANADGSVRCYAWVALRDGGRKIRTLDFEPDALVGLPQVGEVGLRHLVHVLLGELT